MSTQFKASQQEIGRRTMLERSAVGGAALAAGFFGLGGIAEAGAGQSSAGLAKSVTTGRLRRVVSAHDGEGKSFIASDEEVTINDLWSTTDGQMLGAGPVAEAAPDYRATGDSRCFIATMERSSDPMPSLENRIGFHQTMGVAYVLVLTGEIVFLVDREEVRLRAGDLVVERGTMHSWRNEEDTPVGLLVTLVSAEA
jgi:mannose-6-phosphate isomerase-like protein (cupin superfamily)